MTEAASLVRRDRFVELPVERLALAPWNYKLDDDEKVGKLINNVKLNGQVENLIVRELPTGYFEVVNGNHRLIAFLKMGLTSAVCYNVGPMGDTAAYRLAIETNETKFDVDEVKLAGLIKDILTEVDEGALLATMPFSQHQLDYLKQEADVNWEGVKKELEDERDKRRQGKGGVCQCPQCHLQFAKEQGA
jgi:ParB-like chromosome segregation protein Spo0J